MAARQDGKESATQEMARRLLGHNFLMVQRIHFFNEANDWMAVTARTKRNTEAKGKNGWAKQLVGW